MGRRQGSGRDPRRERAWRGRLERWRSGGGSVRAFCRREGVAEPSFYYWRRELARRDGAGARRGGRAAPLFLPVRVKEAGQASGEGVIELRLPSGHVLRGSELEKLARLAALLGKSAC
jgi:transposase